MGTDSSPGIPGWFIGLFILMALLSVGGWYWRVSAARRMAQNAGLDPNAAATVTMLGHDGMSATYLASTLASHRSETPPLTADSKSVEQRLAELQALKDKAMITDAEYEAQRLKILGSI